MKDLQGVLHIFSMRITRDHNNPWSVYLRAKNCYQNSTWKNSIQLKQNSLRIRPNPGSKRYHQWMKKRRRKWETFHIKKQSEVFHNASQGTRPDLSYAVGLRSRITNNHTELHWNAVKRLVRYLKNTVPNKLNSRKEEIL